LPGGVAPGFEGVADAFEGTLSEGGGHGAAFAAVVDGELVVDLWGGIADGETGAPWREETMQLVFSGTKGLVAACLLLLIERGTLQLDAPVARFWPEFAAAGKDGILVRHVVSHVAGLPLLPSAAGLEEVLDGERMAAALATQRPLWPAGERLAYHGITFGWLCGELVRRVDGRSAGRLFAEEIAAPLGLELWIGLPAELEPRVARLRRAPDFEVSYAGDEPNPLLAAEYGPLLSAFPWNEPAVHRAEIPAANAIGTARSIARLYGCLARGGELDGVRLLSEATVRLGASELSRGPCAITQRPYAFGVGFELQTALETLGPPPEAFGHTGSGGSSHGAWPVERVGFSYAMNELRREEGDDRARSLLVALHEALPGA
jgi:CubicO group peptidase (beta-lactamase class C family)